MRRHTETSGNTSGPSAMTAFRVAVRLRASYLLGRWAQAPISIPAREADT